MTQISWSDLIFRVVSYCESRGWQRIYDKTRTDYKLKWCEAKSPAAYYSFKAGDVFRYDKFTAIMKKRNKNSTLCLFIFIQVAS